MTPVRETSGRTLGSSTAWVVVALLTSVLGASCAERDSQSVALCEAQPIGAAAASRFYQSSRSSTSPGIQRQRYSEECLAGRLGPVQRSFARYCAAREQAESDALAQELYEYKRHFEEAALQCEREISDRFATLQQAGSVPCGQVESFLRDSLAVLAHTTPRDRIDCVEGIVPASAAALRGECAEGAIPSDRALEVFSTRIEADCLANG